MNLVLTLMLVAPLLSAALAFAAREREELRDALTLAGLGTAAGAAAVMFVRVADDGPYVMRVGGWHPELGIVLVADRFAALVLPVALAIIFVVELFAISLIRKRYMDTPILKAMFGTVIGGMIVFACGILIGKG